MVALETGGGDGGGQRPAPGRQDAPTLSKQEAHRAFTVCVNLEALEGVRLANHDGG
jgi:hypothetical protein